MALSAASTDYRCVELFVFEHGRGPVVGDGKAWRARQRLTLANLREQLDPVARTRETNGSRDWRRRTATM